MHKKLFHGVLRGLTKRSFVSQKSSFERLRFIDSSTCSQFIGLTDTILYILLHEGSNNNLSFQAAEHIEYSYQLKATTTTTTTTTKQLLLHGMKKNIASSINQSMNQSITSSGNIFLNDQAIRHRSLFHYFIQRHSN